MTVFRGSAGDVRLVWRLLIIVVLSVVVAVLLRFIPIFLYTAILVRSGMAQESALATAKQAVFEGPIWSTVLGVLNAAMYFLLVWFLVRVIERGGFRWQDVGLDWRRSSLPSLVLGGLLALAMYLANGAIDQGLVSLSPAMRVILSGLGEPRTLQVLVLWIAMGFGEEIVFRGYVQTRLVERQGAIVGVLLASIIFTLVHLAVRPLTPLALLSGIILWTAMGALYHWARSLYLVGMYHGIANGLSNAFPLEAPEHAGLIVHAVTLLLVVIVALYRSRASRVTANPT
jgi:membrane protease YdiL (CAAX protease family)